MLIISFEKIKKIKNETGKSYSLIFLILSFSVFFFANCAETIQLAKEKAESEEGKQAIEKLKEKIGDKETQEKLKGMIGGKEKKSPLDK